MRTFNKLVLSTFIVAALILSYSPADAAKEDTKAASANEKVSSASYYYYTIAQMLIKEGNANDAIKFYKKA